MRRILFLLLFTLSSSAIWSQVIIDSTLVNFLSRYPDVEIVPVARDTSYWKSYSRFEILFSENYYKNWAAGGNNMVMGVVRYNFNSEYNRGNLNWGNVLKMEYGLNRAENSFTRKSTDLIDYTGNFGYKVYEKWYASSQLRFTTQFANGYDYRSDGNHILKSSFLSPAKVFIGIGGRYTKDDNFYMYISPFTENISYVMSDTLARKGDINKNLQNIYIKIGPWVDLFWRYNFYKDYVLSNKLSLYSDYVYRFGAIDFLDWQVDLNIPLHKYFTVSFGLHIRYERDVLFDVVGSQTGEKEPRVQFRQLLGIGFKYEL